MREAIANPLAYYASQSYITDPRAYARLFESDMRLRVPPAIKCYTQAGVRMVDLAAEEEFS
jgi:hypothetical protein